VTIYHAPTGARLGAGEGICTTHERKYAYRQAQRKCPDCGAEAVIKGKKEYGGGWLCWAKKGGCNSKWDDGATEIEGQFVGDVENPDLPDLWNTVDKMATKRALVAAVLIVTGASAVFTQDVEDGASGPIGAQPSEAATEPPRPKLDEETVNRIGSGVIALKLTYREVGLILGAHGGAWVGEESSAGLRESLEGLTKDQATAVEAHLEKVAQDKAAEAPQAEQV